MRWSPKTLLLILCLGCAASAAAASGRVLKVLPHFLDLKGRHTLSPSLYDRDAYQAQLRQHPEQRSGMRFDVQWRGKGDSGKPLKLRLELRGIPHGDLPGRKVIEVEIGSRSRWGRWTAIPLTGEDCRQLGEVTGWRITLLDDQAVLGEQQSFLW